MQPLWCDGLNIASTGDAFAKAAARLLAEQLEVYDLAISAVEPKAGRGLESTRDGAAGAGE